MVSIFFQLTFYTMFFFSNSKQDVPQDAKLKRENFKLKHSTTRNGNTKESITTVMSQDIIKELVDKEVDLEQCIKTIQKLSGDSEKIISGSNSSSVSISLSQKFKTDADVFTGHFL